jgi:hypothetical protein
MFQPEVWPKEKAAGGCRDCDGGIEQASLIVGKLSRLRTTLVPLLKTNLGI